MKRSALFVVVLFVILAGLVAGCGAAAPAGGEEAVPAEDVEVATGGAAILESRCTQCHDLERVKSAAKSMEEWQANVDRMVQKGAKLTDEEKTTLVEYLSDTYK